MVEDDKNFRREDFHELLAERELPLERDSNGYVDPWADIAWVSWKRALATEPVSLPMPAQPGDYITMIRDLRTATGCTLKAAKEAIDASDSDYGAAFLIIQSAQAGQDGAGAEESDEANLPAQPAAEAQEGAPHAAEQQPHNDEEVSMHGAQPHYEGQQPSLEPEHWQAPAQDDYAPVESLPPTQDDYAHVEQNQPVQEHYAPAESQEQEQEQDIALPQGDYTAPTPIYQEFTEDVSIARPAPRPGTNLIKGF